MKKSTRMVLLAVAGTILTQIQPAYSYGPHSDRNLFGSWTMTHYATDSSGNPCPYVPESIKFFIDKTVMIPRFGNHRFPYKTTVSLEEREKIEKRVPELKGKKLLLIKLGTKFDWDTTPMVYAYSVENNELTLILQNWSPAKFTRRNN